MPYSWPRNVGAFDDQRRSAARRRSLGCNWATSLARCLLGQLESLQVERLAEQLFTGTDKALKSVVIPGRIATDGLEIVGAAPAVGLGDEAALPRTKPGDEAMGFGRNASPVAAHQRGLDVNRAEERRSTRERRSQPFNPAYPIRRIVGGLIQLQDIHSAVEKNWDQGVDLATRM